MWVDGRKYSSDNYTSMSADDETTALNSGEMKCNFIELQGVLNRVAVICCLSHAVTSTGRWYINGSKLINKHAHYELVVLVSKKYRESPIN